MTTNYPTPWRYVSDTREIRRETGDREFKVAMVFDRNGVPDSEVMEMILAILAIGSEPVTTLSVVVCGLVQEIAKMRGATIE